MYRDLLQLAIASLFLHSIVFTDILVTVSFSFVRVVHLLYHYQLKAQELQLTKMESLLCVFFFPFVARWMVGGGGSVRISSFGDKGKGFPLPL